MMTYDPFLHHSKQNSIPSLIINRLGKTNTEVIKQKGGSQTKLSN